MKKITENIIDISRGASAIAIVNIDGRPVSYALDPSDPDGVTEFLYREIRERMCSCTGIPLYAECAGWCELAHIGEVFDADGIRIRIEDRG